MERSIHEQSIARDIIDDSVFDEQLEVAFDKKCARQAIGQSGRCFGADVAGWWCVQAAYIPAARPVHVPAECVTVRRSRLINLT